MKRIGALVVAAALAATLSSAAGCAGTAGPPTTFGVNVTIDAKSIPTATRKQVTGGVLTVESAGASLERPLNLASAIQSGEVRFHFTPAIAPGATSGVLTLTVAARAVNGDVLAVGVSPPVTWIVGQAVPTLITLAGLSNNDAGVDGNGGAPGLGGKNGAAGAPGTAGAVGGGGNGGSPGVGGAGGTAKGGATGTGGGVGGANSGGGGIGGASAGGAGGGTPIGTGGTGTGGNAPDAGMDASGCAACTADQYCLAGACKAKHPAGRSPEGGCTDDNQCQTSYCALKDGTCCDSACAGQCESCNVDGKCTLNSNGQVPKASHGGPCTGAGTDCGGFCDGTKVDCVYPTKDCGTAQCSCPVAIVSNCKETPVGKCAGGSCQRSTTSCGGYDCNAASTACLTSCVVSTNGGCSSGHTCMPMACLSLTGGSHACCI